MTPERWQTIERLYHAALERSPGERDALSRGACEGDEALRARGGVADRASAWSPQFLDAPPGQELRAAIAARLARAPAVPGRYLGRMFGPYTLQALLAAGGMGEVYRAVDTRLNRTVAIKILLHDPERWHEFRREAEIVSSLNHPHICTIHDIGSEDGVDYIVMEYLEGETLQQRLDARRAAARASDRVLHTDRRCAGQGTPPRHRSSGHQARQRDAHGGRASRCSTSGSPRDMRGAAMPLGGRVHGHAAVWLARATRWPGPWMRGPTSFRSARSPTK